MQVIEGKIKGVYVITPKVFNDERGFFSELFNDRDCAQAGINFKIKQINYSYSHYGVLRGMHFQRQQAQTKLVWVLSGEIYDVCADINPQSPTFGQYESFVLSAKNRQQLFIPAGLAHGFCVLSTNCAVQYGCDEIYNPNLNAGIRWNDPTLSIDWPFLKPELSIQDQNWPLLLDL